VQTIAEESTAWPSVSRPTDAGGLGFGMKWNMGWMHDVLHYFTLDPVYRKHHHDEMTFSLIYAFYENFLLSLSHDEVVYGKGSFLGKMPGDEWQKFANLRLLLGFLFAHPGKKLFFMGTEFGLSYEWNHDRFLPWGTWNEYQKKTHSWMKDLNHLYTSEKALYENDFEESGFEWLDCKDFEKSILCFLRKDRSNKEILAVFCNFTPIVRENYRVGVPYKGNWVKLLSSDDKKYYGSGYQERAQIQTEKIPSHGKDFSVCLTLPSLSLQIYKFQG
jgi:1,4-alpha-glucan branching enzyme